MSPYRSDGRSLRWRAEVSGTAQAAAMRRAEEPIFCCEPLRSELKIGGAATSFTPDGRAHDRTSEREEQPRRRPDAVSVSEWGWFGRGCCTPFHGWGSKGAGLALHPWGERERGGRAPLSSREHRTKKWIPVLGPIRCSQRNEGLPRALARRSRRQFPAGRAGRRPAAG